MSYCSPKYYLLGRKIGESVDEKTNRGSTGLPCPWGSLLRAGKPDCWSDSVEGVDKTPRNSIYFIERPTARDAETNAAKILCCAGSL
jgi:hypothetical protein